MAAAELRGGNKPSLNEALGWIGSRVDDIYGANVGRLEDVWIDPGTGVPRWLLVKEGRFGGRTTLIPFEDATAGAGHVWVPYERDVVRNAPQIEGGAPLTHQVEAALRSHYTAHAPAAISHRAQPETPAQPQATAPTATVRLRGPSEPGPPGGFAQEPAAQPQSQGRQVPQPQPQRYVLREQPPASQPQTPPPVRLPARPAPPIAAAPPRDRPPAPDPEVYRPPAYAPRPAIHPPPQDAYRQPAVPEIAPQQPPPDAWAAPPAPPMPPPALGRSPVDALQDLAASPEVHYVEIELSGELSIRGELRSVRVVPRGPGSTRPG